MPRDLDDVFFYRAYCDLYGTVQPVATCRRNGKPALCLRPGLDPDADPAGEPSRHREDAFENLTAVERHRWERFLDGRSIPQVAEEDRVTRQAIYECIRGNAKGQGGMIAKNRWVRRWWTRRKEFFKDDELL